LKLAYYAEIEDKLKAHKVFDICSKTDIWALGVIFINLLTKGDLINSFVKEHSSFVNQDINTGKATEEILQFLKQDDAKILEALNLSSIFNGDLEKETKNKDLIELIKGMLAESPVDRKMPHDLLALSVFKKQVEGLELSKDSANGESKDDKGADSKGTSESKSKSDNKSPNGAGASGISKSDDNKADNKGISESKSKSDNKSPNGAGTSGTTANGATANGTTASGASASGTTASGASASGTTAKKGLNGSISDKKPSKKKNDVKTAQEILDELNKKNLSIVIENPKPNNGIKKSLED